MSDLRSNPPKPVIAFEDTGGNGIPIIFSHGIFMNRRMFDPQWRELRPEFRCVRWDARSHGETIWKGSFTLWDSARDLLDLMDRLDIPRAVLCGMSQGGLVSVRAALLAPERVAGIVMLDSQVGSVRPDSGARFLRIAEQWAAHGPDEDSLTYLADLILGPGADVEYWKTVWRGIPWDHPLDAVRALVNREDLTERLCEITCPVRVIHGERDAATSLESARAVADGVPDSRGLFVVPGAPHAANLTHPAEVNSLLREFMLTLDD